MNLRVVKQKMTDEELQEIESMASTYQGLPAMHAIRVISELLATRKVLRRIANRERVQGYGNIKMNLLDEIKRLRNLSDDDYRDEIANAGDMLCDALEKAIEILKNGDFASQDLAVVALLKEWGVET